MVHQDIWKSFSKLLIDYGANVFILDRDNNIYDLAKKLSEQYPNNIIPIKADLYDEKNKIYYWKKYNNQRWYFNKQCFWIQQRYWFNDESGKFEFMSKDQWMKCLDSGLYWNAYVTQIVIEKMKILFWFYY